MFIAESLLFIMIILRNVNTHGESNSVLDLKLDSNYSNHSALERQKHFHILDDTTILNV
jgi:hypothetical protein